MTQAEITKALIALRYTGKYSFGMLAKESGLSRSTITKATAGVMSEATQVRLKNVLRNLPKRAPIVVAKGVPGRSKRYLLRFFNLRRWIGIIEYHARVAKYSKWRYYPRTDEEAGYVCTKMDYVLKVLLLKVFQDEIKSYKMSFNDCYPAEQWIKRISSISKRRDLCQELTKRR